MKLPHKLFSYVVTVLSVLPAAPGYAAVALDRTRAVFNGDLKSVSMTVSNDSKELPYLAQGWLENAEGKKIHDPLVVLPPVQRIEPKTKSQVKIQALPSIAALPQDRETLFYFNLREIPPRSKTPNSLQLALQTRIKLFYRPQAIVPGRNTVPFQEQLTLTRVGEKYRVNNPTPYYITLIDGRSSETGPSVKGFTPLMVAPKSEAMLAVSATALGSHPILSYINDFGGRPKLKFTCRGNECKASPIKIASHSD